MKIVIDIIHIIFVIKNGICVTSEELIQMVGTSVINNKFTEIAQYRKSFRLHLIYYIYYLYALHIMNLR